jgi:hypothetical protein
MDTPATTSHPTALRVVTLAAAVAVGVGGLLHLRTWDADYRSIPDGAVPGLWVVQTGFPANALASVVVAAALIAVALGAMRSLRTGVVIAAIVLQLGSIGALVASRGPGIFGWSETGYGGDAGQILVVEIAATLLLIGAVILGRRTPAA